MPLVSTGAALLATDHIDASANMRDAGLLLASLLTNEQTQEGPRTKIRAALAALGPADGAATVATQILELAR
jgi:hypothetical protein